MATIANRTPSPAVQQGSPTLNSPQPLTVADSKIKPHFMPEARMLTRADRPISEFIDKITYLKFLCTHPDGTFKTSYDRSEFEDLQREITKLSELREKINPYLPHVKIVESNALQSEAEIKEHVRRLREAEMQQPKHSQLIHIQIVKQDQKND